MNRHRNNLGFSLTEMLIATGIMAVGLVMVATIFPVGVKLTTLSTERTLGAVAADEAFAKIQLYGLRDFAFWPTAVLAGNANETYITCNDFQYIANGITPGLDNLWWTADDENTHEFQYPSSMTLAPQERNYHWSALCRRVSDKQVQVTVFVSRKIAAGTVYRAWDPLNGVLTSEWPKPVKVQVEDIISPRTLQFSTTGPWGGETREMLDGGYTIMDDYSGNIYRVLEVDRGNNWLILQQDWVPSPNAPNEAIWVVPPAVGSDRYPCVGVYQRVIRFDEIN